MTNINHVVIVGNITRNITDDERSFGYAANGQARANISIAVNRAKKSGEEWVDEVSYFDITIWGKQAENLKPYLVKGQKVAIDGYLKQDRWEKDGQKMSKITIVADKVELCGNRKNENNNSGESNNHNTQQSFENNYQPDPYSQGGSEFGEDIPF